MHVTQCWVWCGATQVCCVWQQQPGHARQPAGWRRIHRPKLRYTAITAPTTACCCVKTCAVVKHVAYHAAVARSWLIDLANAAIFVHLLGTFLVKCGLAQVR